MRFLIQKPDTDRIKADEILNPDGLTAQQLRERTNMDPLASSATDRQKMLGEAEDKSTGQHHSSSSAGPQPDDEDEDMFPVAQPPAPVAPVQPVHPLPTVVHAHLPQPHLVVPAPAPAPAQNQNADATPAALTAQLVDMGYALPLAHSVVHGIQYPTPGGEILNTRDYPVIRPVPHDINSALDAILAAVQSNPLFATAWQEAPTAQTQAQETTNNNLEIKPTDTLEYNIVASIALPQLSRRSADVLTLQCTASHKQGIDQLVETFSCSPATAANAYILANGDLNTASELLTN